VVQFPRSQVCLRSGLLTLGSAYARVCLRSEVLSVHFSEHAGR